MIAYKFGEYIEVKNGEWYCDLIKFSIDFLEPMKQKKMLSELEENSNKAVKPVSGIKNKRRIMS